MNKAFVISGGGAKGCIQVGMLNYLADQNIFPDIVVGVSTGSLQGLAIAQKELKVLNEKWLSIKSYKDVYTKSYYHYIKVLFGKSGGFYKFDGLRKMIESVYDRKKLRNSGIDYYAGSVNLQTGSIYYIPKNKIKIENILASCTIPIFFEPMKIGNSDFVDGGVRDITPLKQAIEAGADDIYILLASPLKIKTERKNYNNIINVMGRTANILLNEIYRNDISWALRINKLVDKYKIKRYHKIKIHVIAPDKLIMDSLDFVPDKIRFGIKYGYETAKKALTKSEK